MEKIKNKLLLISFLICIALISITVFIGIEVGAVAWKKGSANEGNVVATSVIVQLGRSCPLEEFGVDEITSATYNDSDVLGNDTYLSADSDSVRFFKEGTYIINMSETVYVYMGDATPEFIVPAAYQESIGSESIIYLAPENGTADLTLGISAFDIYGEEIDLSVEVNGSAGSGVVTETGMYDVKLTAADTVNQTQAVLEYSVRVQYPWVLADFADESDANLFTMSGGSVIGISDTQTYNGKNSLLIKPDGRTVYPVFRVAANGALSLETKYSLSMMVYFEASASDIAVINLRNPGATPDSAPVLNQWQKITISNKNMSNTYENLGFLFCGPWDKNVGDMTAPPASVNIYIADVRTTDPAQNLAGAPIREVKCTGGEASEFDLKTLLTQGGAVASGTVANDDPEGTVSYKDGSNNTVLLVKVGETYTFTSDSGATVSIRGTAKDENIYLIPAADSSDLDLITIEGSAVWGSNTVYGVYSDWQSAGNFTIRFNSDGLIDSTKARRLYFRVTVVSTDANIVQATPAWNGTAGTMVQTQSLTFGSETLSFEVPAGAAISDLSITFHKTNQYANVVINSFYVEVTDGSTLDGVNLTKASFGYGSMPFWLSASNFDFQNDYLYNVGSDGTYQPSLTFNIEYEQPVRVYFTVSQASVGEGTFTYTMTTNKDGVNVTNAEGTNVYTLRSWTTGNAVEFWFDVDNGADLQGLILNMTKNTGWANLYVENIRIVSIPQQ